MSSIVVGLNSTWTARWYQAASGTQRADAWTERLRYFRALSELLTELVKGSSQQQIAPRGLVTEVARRAHFSAHETLYKRFRSEWEGPIERWAGTDDAVKPRNALVAEAKIVSFWPYRDGVLRLAGSPGVTLAEVAEAYLSALASWASDDGPLAACRPAGPPACVAEDMSVLVTLWLTQATPDRVIPAPRAGTDVRCERGQLSEKAEQLDRVARVVVQHVLEDPADNPGQAVDAVRDDVRKLLADPMDPLLDQLTRAAAQLSVRLRHAGRAEPLVTAQRARTLLAALTHLATQLREIATELPVPNDSAPPFHPQTLKGMGKPPVAGAATVAAMERQFCARPRAHAVSRCAGVRFRRGRKAADDGSMSTVTQS
jgi:hypothetical protein